MFVHAFEKLKKLLSFSTHERSISASNNTIKIAVVRLISVMASFVMVPLTINFLTPYQYGIWTTLSTIIIWISLFDFGLSNGLRNKLSLAYAVNDYDLARKYISTAYALLFAIFFTLFMILSICVYYLDWGSILKIKSEDAYRLNVAAVILVAYFCMKFVLQIVNTTLLALQKSAKASYSVLLDQLLFLSLVYLLVRINKHGTIVELISVLFISTFLVYSSYTYYIFRGQYKKICPSILKVDFSLSGGLFSVGLKFFVIQVAGIIQFQTASIILIRYYGPLDVAGYSVVFKYFSVMPLLMGLILTPLWSAATDAFAKKDYTWITYAVKRYNVISLIVILVGFFMVCFFEPVMHFWIKDDAVINKISIQMVLLMYAFNVLSVYGSVYNTVLNGIGALDVQFYACLVSPFIFILMCVILISYFNLGVQAVIAASIIANFNAYILMPWQFRIYRREWKI